MKNPEAIPKVSASARAVGIVSGGGTALVTAAYAGVLAAGLLSLPSPDQPIGGPYFLLMEVLILLLMPLLVALMAAVHAWAPPEVRIYGHLALVFMALVAGLTSAIHFVLLTVGRHPAFAGLPWTRPVLSFEWPSLAYALDILAWDVFFPIAALFAAAVFREGRLQRWIRGLLIASGVLSLAGLSGVVTGDMQLRNIGIVGYVGVFPIAALLIAWRFYRE